MLKRHIKLLTLAASLFIPAAEAQYDDKEIWDSVQCSSKEEVLGFVRNNPASQFNDDAEKCLWEHSVNCSNKEQVIDFLMIFPRGQFSESARGCLEEIERREEQDQISRRLLTCEAHIAAGRFVAGPANALDCYLSVLKDSPGNPDALEGFEKIGAALVNSTREALENRDIEQAKLDFEDLKTFNSRHPNIRELRVAIRQAEQLAKCVAEFGDKLLSDSTLDEAAKCYQEVIRENSTGSDSIASLNEEAIARLNEIEDVYVRRVGEMISVGNLGEAERYLEILRELDPNHPQIPELQASIERSQNEQLEVARQERLEIEIGKCASEHEDGNIRNSVKCYQGLHKSAPEMVAEGLKRIEDDHLRRIHEAIDNGQPDVARQFLEVLSEINPDHSQLQSLEIAISGAEERNRLSPRANSLSEELGREFLATQKDENGLTDLHYAAALNMPALTRILLDNDADANAEIKDDKRPLSEYAKRILRNLGEPGINYDGWGRFGQSSLHFASFHDFSEVARKLLENGADSNVRDARNSTPLHYTAFNPSNSSYLVAKMLLEEYRANVAARDEQQTTALHVAARKNAEKLVSILLDHGADVNSKNDKGWTPIHNAARSGANDVVRVLINYDAHVVNVNATDGDGDTPLHDAAQKNRLEAAKLLVENGADVNARDYDGETPLDRAVLERAEDVEYYLRNNNGRCNVTCLTDS